MSSPALRWIRLGENISRWDGGKRHSFVIEPIAWLSFDGGRAWVIRSHGGDPLKSKRGVTRRFKSRANAERWVERQIALERDVTAAGARFDAKRATRKASAR